MSMIGLLMKRKRYGFIILLLILLCLPRDGAAALFEQLAVDTRAVSLGNAVTADPQGPFSIHFNPAGLDRVDGTTFEMGLFYVPVLNIKANFAQGTDPATGKLWAPFGGWFNGGIDPEAGHSSSTTPSVSLPFVGQLPFMAAPYNGYAHHDKDSPFAYGFAVYAPFAVGDAHTDPNDPYRFLGQSMSIIRLVLSPGVSYRLTNSLSIGASVGWGLSFMGFNTRMRAPNDMVALTGALGESTKGLEIPIISELTLPAPWFGGGLSPYEEMGGLKFFAQDTFNTSYNIGLLWEPFSWISFGGVYQSKADADMKGRYRFDYSDRMQKTVNWLGSSPTTIIVAAMLGLPTHVASEDDGTMSISVVYPERVQLGIKLQPHRRIKFLVDANWTHWSQWKSMDIVFDRDMALLQMAKLMGYTGGSRLLTMPNNFKDTWHLSYGLELQPFDPITLRLGYEHRPTSVSANTFGPVPLGDMDLYSVGIGIDQRSSAPKRKIKGLSDVKGILHQMLAPDYLDLSFTYMTSEYKVNFNQSKLFNSTNFTDIIYNPFAGLICDMKTTSYIVSLKQTWLW
jgi:long-subunit fatty acid transport protein